MTETKKNTKKGLLWFSQIERQKHTETTDTALLWLRLHTVSRQTSLNFLDSSAQFIYRHWCILITLDFFFVYHAL